MSDGDDDAAKIMEAHLLIFAVLLAGAVLLGVNGFYQEPAKPSHTISPNDTAR